MLLSQEVKDLWQDYVSVCKNDLVFAMNCIKKVTGKSRLSELSSSDFEKLHEDLAWRKDLILGLFEAEFEFEHGDWGDR